MPSFDIVSEISGHEIRNAVENANRELTNRWDFRNVQATIEFNEKNESIKVSSESDFQVEQLIDILRNACIKRNIESTSLDIPADYEHSGKTYSKEIKLKQGIETDMAKKNHQADQRFQNQSPKPNPRRASPCYRQIPR